MAEAKIEMWKKSLALRIPNSIADALHLKAGEKVEVRHLRGRITIERAVQRKRYSLAALLSQCEGKNPSTEKISGLAGRELF